jgi:hypothetical protein
MAGPQVLVRIDAGELLAQAKTFRAWASDQLPFATAAALTDTAKDAAEFVRTGLPEHFKVRNLGLRNAIQFASADKRARPIESRVGTAEWAEFLTLQALGGVKRGKSGHRIAVPTPAVKRTASGRVPKRQKPRTLRESKSLKVGLLTKRGLIALQVGGVARLYYTLVDAAKIRKRWPLGEEVAETVDAKLGQHFGRRLDQALRTAKPSSSRPAP